MNLVFWPFDIESYPNVFTAVVRRQNTAQEFIFEVSNRKDQSRYFTRFCRWLGAFQNVRMTGYNNLLYDWPVINHCITKNHDGSFTAADAFEKTDQIINRTPFPQRFKHAIWDHDQIVRQVDLMKMHGFDNAARSMSLKMVEIALRMAAVQDLPFEPGTYLRNDQIPQLIGYNRHDVRATEELLNVSGDLIDLRLELGKEFNKEILNKSDIDLGEMMLIEAMEKAHPGITGTRGRGAVKRTTPRSEINLAQLVLPIVQFRQPEFQRIHTHFATTPPITQTKGTFDNLVANCCGLSFKFGTGGIHAATENRVYRATATRRVITVDVSSYYPNLAIKWGMAPEHLGSVFLDEYQRIYERRQQHKKGTNANIAIKLALNAAYGKSGSKYSCLHDLHVTMGITINGQLLLCMLSEWLAEIPTAELFNVNTDGVTMAVDQAYISAVENVMARWEDLTRLKLELDDWEVIFQRDVNNYLGVEKGSRKAKGKGAYEWRHGVEKKANWHKNQSAKIITMAVEEYLVNGVPVEQKINECTDPYLFMHTAKVQRKDRLVLGGYLGTYEDRETPSPKDKEAGKPTIRTVHRGGVDQQKTGRYYVALRGDYLFKIMPPLAKLPNHYRPQAIQSGKTVAMCNDAYWFDWANLDRSHYIEKAKEMIRDVGVAI